jgi:hypothetical protein
MQMVNDHLHECSSPVSVKVRERVGELSHLEQATGWIDYGADYMFRCCLISVADARESLFQGYLPCPSAEAIGVTDYPLPPMGAVGLILYPQLIIADPRRAIDSDAHLFPL